MELSIVLGLIVGLGYTTAFVIYNRKAFNGKTNPNVTTWAIWSLIVIVGTPNYIAVTGDWWKSIIPLLNTVLCIGTFVLVLIRGQFKKPSFSEWGALAVGSIAVIIWKGFGSAAYANITLNVAILVGFIPTWHGIWQCKAKEDSLPWWIWAASYGLAAVVVVLRWKGQWIDLLYPINCTILHATVPLLAAWRGRKFLKGEWSGEFIGFEDEGAVCWIDVGNDGRVKTVLPAYQFIHYGICPGSLFSFDGYILVGLITPADRYREQRAVGEEIDRLDKEWDHDLSRLELDEG